MKGWEGMAGISEFAVVIVFDDPGVVLSYPQISAVRPAMLIGIPSGY